jgi:hypothetical protein
MVVVSYEWFSKDLSEPPPPNSLLPAMQEQENAFHQQATGPELRTESHHLK